MLTKQQKFDAYNRCIQQLKKRQQSSRISIGVCFLLREHINMYYLDMYNLHPLMYDYFQEWFEQKPEGAYMYWWPLTDFDSRIKALYAAIELTNKLPDDES
jgi:hypothetical protein